MRRFGVDYRYGYSPETDRAARLYLHDRMASRGFVQTEVTSVPRKYFNFDQGRMAVGHSVDVFCEAPIGS